MIAVQYEHCSVERNAKNSALLSSWCQNIELCVYFCIRMDASCLFFGNQNCCKVLNRGNESTLILIFPDDSPFRPKSMGESSISSTATTKSSSRVLSPDLKTRRLSISQVCSTSTDHTTTSLSPGRSYHRFCCYTVKVWFPRSVLYVYKPQWHTWGAHGPWPPPLNPQNQCYNQVPVYVDILFCSSCGFSFS